MQPKINIEALSEHFNSESFERNEQYTLCRDHQQFIVNICDKEECSYQRCLCINCQNTYTQHIQQHSTNLITLENFFLIQKDRLKQNVKRNWRIQDYKFIKQQIDDLSQKYQANILLQKLKIQEDINELIDYFRQLAHKYQEELNDKLEQNLTIYQTDTNILLQNLDSTVKQIEQIDEIEYNLNVYPALEQYSLHLQDLTSKIYQINQPSNFIQKELKIQQSFNILNSYCQNGVTYKKKPSEQIIFDFLKTKLDNFCKENLKVLTSFIDVPFPPQKMDIQVFWNSDYDNMLNQNSYSHSKSVKISSLENLTQLPDLATTHTLGVNCITILKKEVLFTGSNDGHIGIYSLIDQRELNMIHAHQGGIKRMIIVQTEQQIKEDKMLISAGDEGKIIIWQVSPLYEFQKLKVIKAHKNTIYSLISLVNNKVIVTGSTKSIKFWNLETGRLVNKQVKHKDSVTCLSIYHEGIKMISSSADNTLKLWRINFTNMENFQTAKFMSCKLEYNIRNAHEKTIIALLPINLKEDFVISTGYDGFIKIWDTISKECVRNFLNNNQEPAFALGIIEQYKPPLEPLNEQIKYIGKQNEQPDQNKLIKKRLQENLLIVITTDSQVTVWDLAKTEPKTQSNFQASYNYNFRVGETLLINQMDGKIKMLTCINQEVNIKCHLIH